MSDFEENLCQNVRCGEVKASLIHALEDQVTESSDLGISLNRAKELLAESVRLMHEAKGPCSWPALDRLKVEIQKL